MKKTFYIILVFLLAAGSFVAGTYYSKRSSDKSTIRVTSNLQKNKHDGQRPETDLSSMPQGTIMITPDRQQIIGARVGRVEKNPVTHKIRLLGKVTADERRVYVINATVDGWIIKTFDNTVGSLVKKNEILAAFYSPEFLTASQAFLYALNSMDRVQITGKETPGQKDQIAQFTINLQQYKDTLRNLGMGSLQIEEMARTRQYTENVDITSPADGFILVRNVSDGLRFNKGNELYKIADLTRIWIVADVFENETQYVKPGIEANVILPYQKKIYQAKVSKVLPIFDPTTRTLKVRLEADNPGYILRPDMFVDVELPVTLPPAIALPADAVLDSGLKKTVFVDLGNGLFEPREVETGWRIGNRIEIVRGLNPGEKVVISGTFMIDSESRLELAAAGMVGTLAKDPVCGVDVSINKAEKTGRKSIYQGKTYYFTSNECKEQFEKNPERYIKK